MCGEREGGGGKEGRCWLWGAAAEAGFAGGGWERQRGGAEPGGGLPWPCRRGAARAAPRRAEEVAGLRRG